ncbi:MAG: hypothetical protein KDJ73_05175 [Notoacmeibacter sp.]|nr:hypothetical protein [Notoacmeibacter sp.]
MGMLKWLAIGMVAVAFAAVSLLGMVPELAGRQQQASAVSLIRATYARNEAEGTRAISRAVRACLKARAGERLPASVDAFVSRSVIVLASDTDTGNAVYAERFRKAVASQARAMQQDLATLDARERAHVQAILSDFSANPEELMGCVAGRMQPAQGG